jgi:hypothetical protein
VNDIGFETLHYAYVTGNTYYSPDFYFELKFSGDSNLYNRDLHLNAGFILGYNEEKYVGRYENSYVANARPSNVLTNSAVTYHAYIPSESSYGTATPHYIFLQVNDFNSNSYNTITAYITNGYIENNILAKCDVVCGFNSFLFNNASDCIFKQRDYFGPVTIDKLQVTLLDMNGKPVDLGLDNYSFSLEFTILYTN